jgi:hypothetical protein
MIGLMMVKSRPPEMYGPLPANTTMRPAAGILSGGGLADRLVMFAPPRRRAVSKVAGSAS